MFINNRILSTDLSTGIPQKRSVFVVIVHFGSRDVTDAAVASLEAGSVTPSHSIVVDHASPEKNTGYAAGLIEGLKQAAALGAQETDLCILLNNDITFDRDTLKDICAWWEQYGGPRVLAGAAGGYVSMVSGRAHISSGVVRANPWNIPYIHGSCLVGEFGLLSSGIFSPSFFMYWEDVAASIHVRKSSGALAVIPGLTSVHNDAIAPVSDTKLYYMVRNGAYVLERLTSPPWRVYWYVIDSMRKIYHRFFRDERHAIIARALSDARAMKLGKADV